jgi:hypothetical protein
MEVESAFPKVSARFPFPQVMNSIQASLIDSPGFFSFLSELNPTCDM